MQGISTGDIVNLNVCEEVNKVCAINIESKVGENCIVRIVKNVFVNEYTCSLWDSVY